jgi:hypothetical protein
VTSGSVPVLWLCGPSGVGKSTTGFALFRQLADACYLDVDQIRLCYPSTHADEERLVARNLRAMWPNYLAAGVRRAVITGCVDSAQVAGAFVGALPGAAVTMCRLRVGLAELRARFVHRGYMLNWLDDVDEEFAMLDATDFADVVVDTGGLSVEQAVAAVREAWR